MAVHSNSTLSLSIGSDHAGFPLKDHLAKWLHEKGYQVEDVGCHNLDSVNYPDYGKKVASQVASKVVDRGILVCGSGIGMSITANRFEGVRATLCHSVETSRLSREHNDSNLLVLGARIVSEELAVEMLITWLETEFEGGRHQTRLDMIESK